MKYNYLIGLLIFLVTPCYSQAYESIFGKDITSWSYLTDYDAADVLYTIKYEVYADTLIAEQQYKILYEERNYDRGNGIVYGFIREDTLEGKIWIKKAEYPDEILIMDLNVSLNDTFRIKDVYSGNYYVSYIVTDIYTENERKIIELDHGILKFIEGTGISLIYRIIEPSGYISSLLCHHKDSTLQYIDPFYNVCDTVFGVYVPGFASSNFKIYPNPSTDRITIELSPQFVNDVIKEVVIYNIAGEIEITKKFDSEVVVLDLSMLPKGLFVVRINNKFQSKLLLY